MDQAEQLRNIIKASNVKRSKPTARVITVTSGKGGVGKSNTAINLAIQFRKMGKKVIILDADFGLANIEIMFGAVPKHNMSDLIYQGKGIKDIITWGPMDVGFISGGSGIAGLSNLNRDYLTYIIQNLSELDEITDVIIVDSYSLLKALNGHPRFQRENTTIQMLANRVESVSEGEGLFQKLDVVVSRYLKLPISYLGAVPQDPHLAKAVMQQLPVSIKDPQSKSAQAYEEVAAKLMKQGEGQNTQKRGVAAFFSHIIGKRNV